MLTKTQLLLSAAVCLVLSGQPQAAPKLPTKVQFHLEAQPLSDAVTEWAKQSGLQLIWPTGSLNVVSQLAPKVSGLFSPNEALSLLLAGTGLTYSFVDAQTVEIRSVARASALQVTGDSHQPSPPVQIAQTSTPMQKAAAPSSEVALRDPKSSTDKQSIDEVTVTGSRLRQGAADGAQQVHVYTQERIAKSGQQNVGDFLNTLAEVSISSNQFAFRSVGGTNTVQLHGLPVGTTLVLINGRRVESTGVAASVGINAFDLNSIPIGAVDRVEVISAGSSAVYGSDAIAGVVNVIMRKEVEALEISAKFGGSSGMTNKNVQLAWGANGGRGSFSIVSTFEDQSELAGADRTLSAAADFRPWGGPDTRGAGFCSPGDVYSVDGTPLPGLGTATFAAVPAGYTGTPSQEEFAATAGTQNVCGISQFYTLIPDSQKFGVFAFGRYEIAESAELFTELMYTRLRTSTYQYPPYLFGQPGALSYTVSAANPFNPFGTTVGISNMITGLGRAETSQPTDFYRPLAGVRGEIGKSWNWEVAAWLSRDRSSYTQNNQLSFSAVQAALNSSDPATALNPFVDGPLGSDPLLQSLLAEDANLDSRGEKKSANGFVRGDVLDLPAGPLQVVIGSEVNRDKLDSETRSFPGRANERTVYTRESYAAFAETHVPLVPSGAGKGGMPRLAVSAAARYDHDELFGGKTTPQYGLEWRPLGALLVRGTYGEAFKAPDFRSLFRPAVQTTFGLRDPQRGGAQYTANRISGGNQNLEPETGDSRTIGVAYTSETIPGLHVSLTKWDITSEGSIQAISPQTIINNESVFPGRVIRNPAGFITLVDSTIANYGRMKVSGYDFRGRFHVETRAGTLVPSVSVVHTDHYTTALLPGQPETDRLSRANTDWNWAPKWKGTLGLDWTISAWRTSVIGRYIGKYRDYERLPNGLYQTLGDFWLVDASVNFAFDSYAPVGADWMSGSFFELGASNIFDEGPQFSNSIFGLGYDGTQADIRGRFAYVRVGKKW